MAKREFDEHGRRTRLPGKEVPLGDLKRGEQFFQTHDVQMCHTMTVVGKESKQTRLKYEADWNGHQRTHVGRYPNRTEVIRANDKALQSFKK